MSINPMKLITETIEETNIISEGTGVDKQYFIEGPFMSFDIKNQNGRVYPKNVLLREMANYNEKFVSKNRSLGELGHSPNANVNLDRVSHIIKRLWAEDKHVYGRAKIMDTPFGKIVKNFIDEGAKLGVSSRGVGTVDNRSGQNIIQDDYRLITVDIVADPSAPEAFVNGILEGREFVYLDSGIISEKTLDAYKSAIKSAESKKQLEENMLGVFSDFLSKLRQV